MLVIFHALLLTYLLAYFLHLMRGRTRSSCMQRQSEGKKLLASQNKINGALKTSVQFHDVPHKFMNSLKMAVQAPTSGLAGVQWRPVLLISLMFAVVGFGFSVSVAAQLRLLEDIICTAYYEKNSPITTQGGGVHENICKTTEIQEVLAQVLGWQSFFENMPGLLLAMPYGVVADKYGRKVVLVASMIGMFLSSIWVLFVCKPIPTARSLFEGI